MCLKHMQQINKTHKNTTKMDRLKDNNTKFYEIKYVTTVLVKI